MKKYLILGFILALALIARVYRLHEPLADWHSWRQADTVAVTRRFVAEGIDLLHPKYDDLSSIPSGKENPEGYRMVEFPFVNGLTAALYQTIPMADELEIHVFSRIISIIFSLGSLTFLYLLVDRLSGQLEAALTAAVFALLPYNIFYSRVVLPEVPMVFFSLGSIYFLVKKIVDKKPSLSWELWVSAVFAALALLLKPYAIFLSLPITYFVFKEHSWAIFKNKGLYIFLVVAIMPFVLWRFWIQQFPEGIPAFMWLLNGNGIRFKGSFFRWIFADRFGRLILGYFGLIPLGIGIIAKSKIKAGWFYHWWLIAIFAFVTVFATGNVQHDYYQIFVIPIFAIFVARGLAWLLSPPSSISKISSFSLAAASLIFTFAFGWFFIRDFYNINNPQIVEAGYAANKILSQDAKVIAPYQGDTAFLYQTNRRGWPIGGNIQDKIRLGATEYVTTTFDDEANDLMQTCRPFIKNDTFAIINLRDCNFDDL